MVLYVPLYRYMSTSYNSSGVNYKVFVFEGGNRTLSADVLPSNRTVIEEFPEQVRAFVRDLFERGEPTGYHQIPGELHDVVVAISPVYVSPQRKAVETVCSRAGHLGVGFGDRK